MGRLPLQLKAINLFLVASSVAVFLSAQGTALAGGAFKATKGDDVIHGNKLIPAASAIQGDSGDDRIWGGRGHDMIYGGSGNDRLHNFQAASGSMHGGTGYDVCVAGVKPGAGAEADPPGTALIPTWQERHDGLTFGNVTVFGCEKIVFRASQGHG